MIFESYKIWVCKRRCCTPSWHRVVHPTRAKQEGRHAQVHACTFDRDRYATRCCEEKEPVAFIVQGQHTLRATSPSDEFGPLSRTVFSLLLFFFFTFNPLTFSLSRQNASTSICSLKQRSMASNHKWLNRWKEIIFIKIKELISRSMKRDASSVNRFVCRNAGNLGFKILYWKMYFRKLKLS